MPTTTQQVQDAYHAITRKTLDNTTAQATADNINNGGQTFEQYVAFTSKLKSTMDTAGAVLKIFQILTGRTPDAASFDSIVTTITNINAQYNVSAGYTAIGADLATWSGATQFNALYKNVSLADFVISAHQDVFGVTPGDVNAQIATYNIYKGHYANFPIAGDMSGDIRARGALLADFVHQANDIALRDNSTTFPWGAANKYVIAEYNFEAQAVAGTAVYGGSLFTQPGYQSGSSLILTAGNDNLTGTTGDDFFDARVNGYLGTGDIINGGSGTDTIEARYTAAGQTVAPILTSIENLFVRVDAAGANVTYNAADSGALQALWADRLDGNAADTLTLNNVSKTTVVGVRQGDGDMTVTANFTNAAGAADAATLSLDAANVAVVNIANIETLAVQNTGASTVTNLNAAQVTALNISGTGTATLTGIDIAAASTIGITGAVNVVVDLDDATTVTAGAATGSITLTNVGAVAGNLTITTGTGADVLNVGANIANVDDAQDTIDLGGGIDRVVVDGNIADGNFDRISLYEEAETVGANRTIDMDAFNGTTVGLFAGGSGTFTVSNFVTTTAVTARTDFTTMTLNAGVGANATATLNLNPTPTDGADITALASANVQTLNVNSQVGLLAAGQSNSVALNNTNDTLTTINVTGAGALTLTNGEANVATINAAAFTGAATITVDQAAAALTLTAGTGNDTVTLAAGIISPTDVLNGGAGATDVLNIIGANGASTGTATVTAFETVAFNLNGVNAYTGDLTNFAGYTALNLDVTNAQGVLAFSSILGAATVNVAGAMGNTGNLSLAFAGTTGNATFGGAFGSVTGVQTLTIDEATVNLTAGANATIDVLSGAAITSLNLNAAGGNDIIIASAANTTVLATITGTGTGDIELGSIAGNSTVARTAGATVTTSSGNDVIVVDISSQGANVISAGTGTDTLGLIGAAAGTVVIDLTSGTDQIVSVNAVANAAAQTGFENVNASQMTGAGITVTGSTVANILIGSAQVDTLSGGNGDDTISGGGGADVINAGEGVDQVTIGNGQDVVTLTEVAAVADTLIWATAFAASNANAASVTDFAFGAGVDVIDFQVNLQNGTTVATSTLAAIAPVAIASDGTATANDVIFTLGGAGDLLAGGTNIGNAVANAVTALTSGTDFSSANIATGDSLLLVMNDGTNTFVFHYVADGTAGTTAAADLALVGMFNGLTAVTTGDFI